MLIRPNCYGYDLAEDLITAHSTMPANVVAFRAQCGTFYWTFIAFMAKREQVDMFRSQFKTVSFFPCHCGLRSSHCGLNFSTDCALFDFRYKTYSYSDNSVYTEKHCGNLTTAFVVVFLATFLMQCMDVESNPGPDTRNNWDRGGDYLRAAPKQGTCVGAVVRTPTGLPTMPRPTLLETSF